MFRHLALMLSALLIVNIGHAQTPKITYVKLKVIYDSTAVELDSDSVKFYFKPSAAIRYLERYQTQGIYLEASIDALLKLLKSTSDAKLYIRDTLVYTKDGLLDTSSTQSKYSYAASHLIPQLLINREVIVYDVKARSYIDRIRIAELGNGDYIGPFTEFKAYYANGNVFYQTVLRGEREYQGAF